MGNIYRPTVTRRLLVFLFMAAFSTSVSAQNFIFKHPRQGGFKLKEDDRFDFTNAQHFTGSGILAVGLYDLLRDSDVRSPKIMAGLLASGIGLLKEFEDGYREGWGMKDVIFNELGIITFLFVNQHTKFTLTLKQVITAPDDYGAGIRFFRSAEFSPLNTSLGIYVIYNNYSQMWVGVDSHFGLGQGFEFHAGISMINLDEANTFQFRPNFGLAVRLF